MAVSQLTDHFEFGKNWQSYVSLVDEELVSEAIRGLQKLIPEKSIVRKDFLDVGCGSGLSMLAALRLGASSVQGIDIDDHSVAATQTLLSKFAPGERWQVSRQSILDLNTNDCTRFDIVHSWGVLHHTSDMWSAISKTASSVKEKGLLVIALYHKTPCCGFWQAEKKFYAHARPWLQRLIRSPYKLALLARIASGGKNPWKVISTYKTNRGMDWHHDVQDWLGGYPYESTLPSEVVPYLRDAGFQIEQVFENAAGCRGFFGTGCDEYVARRVARPGV